jgi:hypothetical protein
MVWYPDFAAGCGAGSTGMLCTAQWANWQVLCMMAVVIVMLFYGIVYMLGYAFSSEELKKSAKAHFYDALVVAGLAMFVVVFMTSVFGIIQSFFAGATVSCDMYGKISLDSGDPFDIIKCKLMEKASYLSSIYERVYFSARDPFKKLALMWGLFGLPLYMQGSYIFSTKISDVYREVESYRLIAHLCIVLLTALNAYIGAIDYVSANMLRMFLPAGIILRAIPFTRGVGAVFIALALGFYVIFPFLFMVTDPTFVKTQGAFFDVADKSSLTFPWPTFKGAVSLITMGPQTESASLVFGSVSIREGASELSKLYYGTIIQPIMVLSVTLVFVRYLAMLLGGESQELMRVAARVV